MADNKKYYYLKLKDNFFDSDEMIVLESMIDGYKYSNILMKLYLRSLKGEGKLMFNDRIPFNSQMLATITRHSVGDVEKAIKLFKELNLIDVLDNGAIYMIDIQNFIGESSTEADRVRAYRKRIETDKNRLEMSNITNVQDDLYKCTPELEKELEIEIEKEIDKEKKKKTTTKRFSKPSINELQQYITDNNFKIDAQHFFDYYESKGWLVGKSPMKDWKATVRNWNRRNEEVKPKPNSPTKVIKKAYDEKPPEVEMTDEERKAMIDRIRQGISNE